LRFKFGFELRIKFEFKSSNLDFSKDLSFSFLQVNTHSRTNELSLCHKIFLSLNLYNPIL